MSDNIRKIGNTYHYDFMLDNKRYRGSCKTSDKKLAENIADTIKADILRNKHSLPSQINYQFKDVFDNYIKFQSPGKNKDLKISSSKHFLPVFKDKNISDITTADIKNYQSQRKIEIMIMPKNIGKKESEISFRMANAEIITLSHFFNYCLENKYLDKKNPASKIKKLNELSRLKTLSDEDIEKLINGATNKLTKDLITFLIYTGCRKGEALNLKWDDVDLKNDVIAIKATKTRYDRYIPISKPLKELLTGIEKKDCDYVFNKDGRKIGDFKKSFHTACRNAGIKDLHIHDLRHVFASKMVMNDTSLYKTGILLGHRTPNMTQRYAHLKPGELKKEIEKAFTKKNKKSEEEIKREEYERALEIIKKYKKNVGK